MNIEVMIFKNIYIHQQIAVILKLQFKKSMATIDFFKQLIASNTATHNPVQRILGWASQPLIINLRPYQNVHGYF